MLLIRCWLLAITCGTIVSCTSSATKMAADPPVETSDSECVVDRTLAHERLHGVLWVQTSAEYQDAARSAYRQAQTALSVALSDTTRTAALEQESPYSQKPPAVILDIDETVFDNSPFQAQLILNQTNFLPQTWDAWVLEAKAQWVPGAREYIEYATSQQVAVFFITNRTITEELKTRENFANLNYSLLPSIDQILSDNEKEKWTSDKTSRRAFLTDNYRIVAIVGDDLNNFVAARGSIDERQSTALKYSERFGVDWFLIPNSLYGYWERALYGSGTDCAMIDEKRVHLKGF